MVWKVAVEGGRGGEGGLGGLATRPASRRAKLRTLNISEDVRCDLDDGKTSWTKYLKIEALNLEDGLRPQVRGSKRLRVNATTTLALLQVPAYSGAADEIGAMIWRLCTRIPSPSPMGPSQTPCTSRGSKLTLRSTRNPTCLSSVSHRYELQSARLPEALSSLPLDCHPAAAALYDLDRLIENVNISTSSMLYLECLVSVADRI